MLHPWSLPPLLTIDGCLTLLNGGEADARLRLSVATRLSEAS